MTQAFSRAPVPAPSGAAAQDERQELRLFCVLVNVLRRELDSLGLDEDGLSRWSGLPVRQIRVVLETGQATRIQVRRIRRGLRMAWLDKAGPDAEHWLRLTLRYLAPDVK